MQSLKYLYKMGRGPSSSHTMGPYFASKKILELYPSATKFHVTLYNSLALTGEGHLTYDVIKHTLHPRKVKFSSKIKLDKHPNTMKFKIFVDEEKINEIEIRSVGGGEILFENEEKETLHIYPHKNFLEIKNYCLTNNLSLYQYVKQVEGEEIDEFLMEVWQQMQDTIQTGLQKEGVLPGKLQVKRKAKQLLTKTSTDESEALAENRLISAYAFAVNEENASGGIIVTAPTCGASGTLPSVLYYFYHKLKLTDQKIIEALATAGIIGNIIKHNATISGAVGGCQAEVGSACSMAAAAYTSILECDIDQIEYAAEVSMEHHLGLTCDPVEGFVQIPCIERNAVAAIRAVNASRISYFLSDSRKISFDMIVKTMYQTGLDMHPKYKETAEAGMAYFYNELNK